MNGRTRASICLFVAVSAQWTCAVRAEPWRDAVLTGASARQAGSIDASITALEQAVDAAPTPAAKAAARVELSRSFVQAGKWSAADAALAAAYAEAPPAQRFPVALALGNLALRTHDEPGARRYYAEVIATAGEGPAAERARVGAELNLVRLEPSLERLGRLEALAPRVAALPADAFRWHAVFSVGELAAEAAQPVALARPGDLGRLDEFSARHLRSALEHGLADGDPALAVDAGDALAGLDETLGRTDDAYALNRRMIALAERLPNGRADFPLARLEWRAARLERARGLHDPALASFLRASQHLQAIRQDLPIEDADGRSTYATWQRPIFLGLLDLLLDNVDGLGAAARQARLVAAIDAIELAHEAELQDYLGDRCSVDSAPGGAEAAPVPGLAIVYTLVVKNRVEVLVRTHGDILHHAAALSSASLVDQIQDFRGMLIDAQSDEYLGPARKLYDQLFAPLSTQLDRAEVRELVIVPDGYLRLLPFAVLHDGKQFLAQRYWLSTMTGLSMTEPGPALRRRPATLLAGLATPGPVVDRLLAMGFSGTPDNDHVASRSVLRSIGSPAAGAVTPAGNRALASSLALPGVEAEIHGLTPLTHSVRLVNEQFTVARFAHEVESGDYDVVHIASHGFFGRSVAESFLLAYDDVIHIDELQRVISVNDAKQTGIDLLTLSACDTAAGDERAPLGFAGAGVKARARSVMGSLWAVSDAATERFMTLFYGGLASHGKAEAFTLAQRSLIGSPQFSHPFYWAPFVLTGDWN